MRNLTVLILIASLPLFVACDDTTTTGTDGCGNGALDPGEACDTTLFGGQTCLGLGYYGGNLTCLEDCTLDLTGCEDYGRCGDGEIQAGEGESCDGTALGGAACGVTEGTYPGDGVVTCRADCTLDLDQCLRCGDGILQADQGETCDGMALKDETCRSQGFDSGALACGADCADYDFSGCAVCGDGLVNGAAGEACDSFNLNGASCADIGMDTGDVGCSGLCLVNYGGCHTATFLGPDETVLLSPSISSVDIGDDGFVFLAGYYQLNFSTTSQRDCVLIKASADGEVVWEEVFGATGTVGDPSEESCSSMVRSGETLHVLGTTDGTCFGTTPLSTDVFLTRYSADRAYLGTTVFQGSGTDTPSSLKKTPGGNLVFAVTSDGDFQGYTGDGTMLCHVMEVTMDGTPVWTTRFEETLYCESISLSVDSAGNIYAAGYARGGLNGIPPQGDGTVNDLFVVKLDPSGNILWTELFGTGIGGDSIVNITVDSQDTLWVLGQVGAGLNGEAHLGASDNVLVRFSPQGDTLETVQFGSEADDLPSTLMPTADGNLLVTTSTTGDLPGFPNPDGETLDIMMKLTEDGTELWTRVWVPQVADTLGQCAEGDQGALYCVGSRSGVWPRVELLRTTTLP